MAINNQERMTIAMMVKAIWEANRPEAADRSIALGMLTSNLQHEERKNKKMLYDCGTLTPDQLAEGKAIWKKVPVYERGVEHTKILEILSEIEW